MEVPASRRPTGIAPSVVLSSALVAFVGNAGLANCMGTGVGLSSDLTMHLLLVTLAVGLTLVLNRAHGEDVLLGMAQRYCVRLLVWLVFGVALSLVFWDLLQMEFILQMGNFKG